MPVRALLFDTFGTVVDWRSSIVRELAQLAAAKDMAGDWPAIADAWRGRYVPSMNKVRSGELPWTPLDVLHRAALDEVLAAHASTGFTPAPRDQLTLGGHRLPAWPDAAPGLARLHTRFMLGPLSNGNVSLLVDLARLNRLPWDMVFGADVSGHYKPDPETYLGACRMLALDPAHVMMCAAHNSDLAAAQALGLRTAFILRPAEHGPGQTTDLAATGAWDFAVDSVEALAGQLGV